MRTEIHAYFRTACNKQKIASNAEDLRKPSDGLERRPFLTITPQAILAVLVCGVRL
jgi:hypothetical protein